MLIRAVRDVVIALTLDARPSVRPSVCHVLRTFCRITF